MRVRPFIIVGIALALAAPAAAAPTTVAMSESGFSPSAIAGRTGKSVTWQKRSGYHNVASTQSMFTSGSPTSESFNYTRTFSAGTFPFVCQVHPQSMRGTVRVRPRIGSAPAGAAFTVTWASGATNTGSNFLVQYRVGNGSWRTWKSGTTSDRDVFGASGSPLTVRAGTRYSFRVKSRRAGNASSYSPAAVFTP